MKSRSYKKEHAPTFGDLYEQFKASLPDNNGGAIVSFTGIVRQDVKPGDESMFTSTVEIEGVEGVLDEVLQSIASGIETREGILKAVIVHFTGLFNLGEPMVHVFVCGAHRQEAFNAIEDVVNMYKSQAPLWKKEIYTDGTSCWIKH